MLIIFALIKLVNFVLLILVTRLANMRTGIFVNFINYIAITKKRKFAKIANDIFNI